MGLGIRPRAVHGRRRDGLLTLLVGLAAVAGRGTLPAQTTDSLPPGVTPAMVARGKTVYAGPGLCFACHGPTGAGGVGPSLTDTVWLHHDGSFDALVRQIREGIPLGESKGGQIMPPRGGGAISEQDLSAVAAYVWTLSRVPRSPR